MSDTNINTEIEEIKKKLTAKTKKQSGQQEALIQLIDQLMSQFEKANAKCEEAKQELKAEKEKNSTFEQTNKEIQEVLKNLNQLYTNNETLQRNISDLGTILPSAQKKGGYRYKPTRSKSKRKNKSNKSRRLSGNLTRKKRYRL